MKKITPNMDQIRRTEHKDWESRKVTNLKRLLETGRTDILNEPVYLVRGKCDEDSYPVYDGNTRHFLAENGLIILNNIYLLETNADLEEVRCRMKEIYWPGEDLESIIGYLGVRAYLYSQSSGLIAACKSEKFERRSD